MQVMVVPPEGGMKAGWNAVEERRKEEERGRKEGRTNAGKEKRKDRPGREGDRESGKCSHSVGSPCAARQQPHGRPSLPSLAFPSSLPAIGGFLLSPVLRTVAATLNVFWLRAVSHDATLFFPF